MIGETKIAINILLSVGYKRELEIDGVGKSACFNNAKIKELKKLPITPKKMSLH